MPVAFAWDLGPVMAIGAHMGADMVLLAALAPEIEPYLITAWTPEV